MCDAIPPSSTRLHGMILNFSLPFRVLYTRTYTLRKFADVVSIDEMRQVAKEWRELVI
jgi:hypothetical protein